MSDPNTVPRSALDAERENTDSAWRQYAALKKELDSALAACAEMRTALELCQKPLSEMADITSENRAGWALRDIDHALSTSHGKGWVSPEKHKKLQTELAVFKDAVKSLKRDGWMSPEEAATLKASRAALVEQEQRTRVELNRLRGQLTLAVEALEKMPCTCQDTIQTLVYIPACARCKTLAQLKGEKP